MMEAIPRQPDIELLEKLESITRRAFPEIDPAEPILGRTDDIEIAPNLHAFFYRPDLIISTVTAETGKVIGYSAAVPIDVMDPARLGEASETAYVYFTAVDPDYQERGLVKQANDAMVELLKKLGYGFMERDPKAGEDERGKKYSDSVAKAYGRAIVTSQIHERYGYGRQRFMRLDLSKIP